MKQYLFYLLCILMLLMLFNISNAQHDSTQVWKPGAIYLWPSKIMIETDFKTKSYPDTIRYIIFYADTSTQYGEVEHKPEWGNVRWMLGYRVIIQHKYGIIFLDWLDDHKKRMPKDWFIITQLCKEI